MSVNARGDTIQSPFESGLAFGNVNYLFGFVNEIHNFLLSEICADEVEHLCHLFQHIETASYLEVAAAHTAETRRVAVQQVVREFHIRKEHLCRPVVDCALCSVKFVVFDGDVELRTAGDTRSDLAVAHTLCTKFADLIAVCDFAECEQRGVQRESRVDFEIFGIFQKFRLLVRRRLQIIREPVGEFRELIEKESCFEYVVENRYDRFGFTVSILGRIDKVVEMLRRSEEELQSGVFLPRLKVHLP